MEGRAFSQRNVTGYTHEMSWLDAFSRQKMAFCGTELAQGEAPELLAGQPIRL
jgi:hypothetical protein